MVRFLFALLPLTLETCIPSPLFSTICTVHYKHWYCYNLPRYSICLQNNLVASYDRKTIQCCLHPTSNIYFLLPTTLFVQQMQTFLASTISDLSIIWSAILNSLIVFRFYIPSIFFIDKGRTTMLLTIQLLSKHKKSYSVVSLHKQWKPESKLRTVTHIVA